MPSEISGIKFSSDKVTSYPMTTSRSPYSGMGPGSCHQSQKRELTASFKASVVLIALVPFCNTQYKHKFFEVVEFTQHKECVITVSRDVKSLYIDNMALSGAKTIPIP